MKISTITERYPVLKEAIKRIKEIDEISELFPPQVKAIRTGYLDGKNLVLSVPTSAGKTLLAELAALKAIGEGKGKAVYVVPLRALASQKYEDFKKKYEPLGIKVAISSGDLDSTDPWLRRYDLIVATSEKLDSLIRHGAGWISQIALVVADEIHLINDESRGPTLEVTLTRLRQLCPEAQILALSATIKNCKQLADWLQAELVLSKFRPVKLYRGIYWPNIIKLEGKRKKIGKGRSEVSLAIDTLRKRKQALIFVSTRRSAEATAERIGRELKGKLDRRERKKLAKLSEKVRSVLPKPTRQCKREAECLQGGASFHHAGLVAGQRALIEENFKNGLIKIICATPTLAMGVDLPAWRVVIRDLKRYYGGWGSRYIPVLEVHQMFGRAGRPKYDKNGQAILVGKTKGDAKDLEERYIKAEPERIYSKLASEPQLRMHLLALIASKVIRDYESAWDFFSQTFFALQQGEIERIKISIGKILRDLGRWKFIKGKDKFEATRLGERVAQLYLDPLTAHELIESLKVATERLEQEKEVCTLAYLQAISTASELKPLSVRRQEQAKYKEIEAKYEDQFIQKIPAQYDPRYDLILQQLKTACVLKAWANEAGEDEILDEYGLSPGRLYSKLYNSDWLLYSGQELALLLELKLVLKDLRKIRLRLKHGVKEELLSLVKLEQIGRVRARKLYNSGLKKPSDLRKVPREKIAALLGPKLAKRIKKEVG